jgi:hypothetical protein
MAVKRLNGCGTPRPSVKPTTSSRSGARAADGGAESPEQRLVDAPKRHVLADDLRQPNPRWPKIPGHGARIMATASIVASARRSGRPG